MLETVPLETLMGPVSSPSGLVYSTGPSVALGVDGLDYFVKGPDPETVFAELAGCLLAGKVGLVVPRVAVCTFAGDRYCGSEKATKLGRNVEPWLANPRRLRNFQDLYATVVVDAWLANNDRNMGNILVRSAGDSYELVMIDFEKSVALKPSPSIQSTMVPARELWPTDSLGKILRKSKPLHPPASMIGRIQALAADREAMTDALGSVTQAFASVAWCEDCVEALIKRASKLPEIVGEIWDLH